MTSVAFYDSEMLLDAFLRTDLLTFVQKTFEIVSPGTTLKLNWHHELICYLLTQVLDGKIPHAVLIELLTDHGAGTLITR